MTLAPRWRKLLGDLNATKGRVGMMVAALTMGIVALSTIVGAYTILTREISRNYMSTNPASALIDVETATPALLAAALSHPDIADAETASIIEGRVETAPGEWTRLLLFVAPDLSTSAINVVLPQAGLFPPPVGGIALEREALAFLDRQIGDSMTIELPGGTRANLPISGTVHDAALAPAWQEQTAYGYISAATLRNIGGSSSLELIKVVVKDATATQAGVDAIAADLALALEAAGGTVHQIQIPPPGMHPHQSQMTGVLAMFMAFAGLALILSAILTASMVSAMLAQQVRQIAVMKAVGGSGWQIASLYLTMVASIGTLATAIALPLGLTAATGFADIIGQLLNFDIASTTVALPVVFALAAIGVLVPLAFVLQPIRLATKATVREALSDQGIARTGVNTDRLQRLLSQAIGIDRTLALALRNAFRRRSRLVLNVVLLGTAGAMFLASLNVEAAWRQQLDSAAAARQHDVEVHFLAPQPWQTVLEAVSSVPNFAGAAPANFLEVAPGRPDSLAVVRTYPDGGHGSLSMRLREAPAPTDTFLVGGDNQANIGAVVNQQAWSLLGRPPIGEGVTVSFEGRNVTLNLTGVLRQILAPATVYVSQSTLEAVGDLGGLVNAVRIITVDRSSDAVAETTAAMEVALSQANVPVTQVMTERTLRQAQSGHVQILIVSLTIMAVVMAAVGAIGLASSQGTSVTERIREFGIMRTIGAKGSAILRNILAEGVFIATLSLPLAVIAALPLSYGIGLLIGTLSFGLALPLVISIPALAIWVATLIVGSIVASLVPAFTAIRMTVRQTLAQV